MWNMIALKKQKRQSNIWMAGKLMDKQSALQKWICKKHADLAVLRRRHRPLVEVVVLVRPGVMDRPFAVGGHLPHAVHRLVAA